jgi:3-oxoacyl-[acyl-carrier protein] reductase
MCWSVGDAAELGSPPVLQHANTQPMDPLFLVTGASSGLGRAVAEGLLKEGAQVIAVARREALLQELAARFPGQVEVFPLDITADEAHQAVLVHLAGRALSGVLVNAAGPPVKAFLETSLDDWDQAYRQLVRWKIALTQALLPRMLEEGYGRMLFLESVTVKQPLENFALSNSMRLAVVGFVKTLSQEVAASGVTLNVLAPGYHATDRLKEVFEKKSQQKGISIEAARREMEAELPVQALGRPEDLASLAAWLLSPASRFITGQTISVDGGLVRGTFG